MVNVCLVHITNNIISTKNRHKQDTDICIRYIQINHSGSDAIVSCIYVNCNNNKRSERVVLVSMNIIYHSDSDIP